MTGQWRVRRWQNGAWLEQAQEQEQMEAIADEMPLTVRVANKEYATIVCSASDLTDLIYGFLASEALILSVSDVQSLDWDEERGVVDVRLLRQLQQTELDYGKRVIGSCCGKSRQFYLRTDARTAKTAVTRVKVKAAACLQMLSELQAASGDFALTGGVHNAALYGLAGTHAEEGIKMLAMRSDIGRHNALDKLYGYALRGKLPTADKMLAFSGRLSSEVILKAAKIGVGMVVSKSAPTDLALRLAHDLGITAVGFARGDRFNVYTHWDRIE